MTEYTTKIRMDERINSEVITQCTITDGRTFTDPIEAAQQQAHHDLYEIGDAWMNESQMSGGQTSPSAARRASTSCWPHCAPGRSHSRPARDLARSAERCHVNGPSSRFQTRDAHEVDPDGTKPLAGTREGLRTTANRMTRFASEGNMGRLIRKKQRVFRCFGMIVDCHSRQLADTTHLVG